MAKHEETGDGDDEPTMSEPQIVVPMFLTGVGVLSEAGVLSFVGWADVSDAVGTPMERRVLVRFSLNREASRQLSEDVRTELRKERH